MSPPKRILVAFHLPEALRDVISGVARFAREERLRWQILCVNAEEFSANFERHRCDGAIVMVRPEQRKMVRSLVRSRTPVVNLLRDLCPKIASVLSDDAAIGRLGAAHLRELGFRKFAFVTLNTSWSRARFEGFASAIRLAGLPAPITTTSLGVSDFRYMSQVRALKTLGKWARALGPGTAVMAPSDFVARTLLSACHEAGIDVPKDIAILGVDNFPNLCELWPATLSSIPQDFAQMGYQAARLLQCCMNGSSRKLTRPVLIPPGKLHVRQSTDVLAFEDPLVAHAMRLIHENAIAGTNVGELLKEVPLSRRWLDQRFKQSVGHTPAEEMRRCRIRAARDLIMETDLPLRQIAVRCRFSFPENLIRAFRAAYGMSPRQYRLKENSKRPVSNAG
jgi:LacI family transcriptional regulator